MSVFDFHFFATSAMVGVIWIVQLVHYPAFKYVAEDQFKEFSFFHQQKITYVVAPLMLLEFMTGLYLLPRGHLWFNLSVVLLALIWISTFVFSVREHNTLLSGKDEESIDRLVKTNWIRTILWTARISILFTLRGDFPSFV